jgi:Clustered mitochondria
VEWFGHRVTAQARLPIKSGAQAPAFPLVVVRSGFMLFCLLLCLVFSGETLVYGSEDQGTTVHTSDPVMNDIMRRACAALNIAVRS